MISCQKGPTRHAYAWQIGPFWQDTLDMRKANLITTLSEDPLTMPDHHQHSNNNNVMFPFKFLWKATITKNMLLITNYSKLLMKSFHIVWHLTGSFSGPFSLREINSKQSGYIFKLQFLLFTIYVTFFSKRFIFICLICKITCTYYATF